MDEKERYQAKKTKIENKTILNDFSLRSFSGTSITFITLIFG